MAIPWRRFPIWLLLVALIVWLLAAREDAGTAPLPRQTIHVNQYQFDPLQEGEPEMPAALRAPAAAAGFSLVQLTGPTQDAWLAQIQAHGWRVLQYYPHYTYLLWSDGAAAALPDRFDFVRWQGRYHPAYKISPELAQPDALRRSDGQIEQVGALIYDDGRLADTLAALARLGAELVQIYAAQPDRAFYEAVLILPAAAIPAVARLETTLWLGYISPQPELEDEMSDQIVAGNYADGAPWPGYGDWLGDVGYDGAGVTWAVIDTGVDYDHPDLSQRIVGGYSFPGACDPPGQPGSDCENGGHGTHVAGILAGDAATGMSDNDGYLYGLGVAPGARLFAMNPLSGSHWPPLGGWQENSKQALLGGAVGGNNSWTTGEGLQHGYQSSERIHDLMARDGNFDTPDAAEPFIQVFSAGNYGDDGLTAPKEAKNLIVVASSENYRVGDIDQVSSFSSRGPAADGRWVPTVAAPGNAIASTRNDTGGYCAAPLPGSNDLYALCSGSSQAAAHASAALALLNQWWRTHHQGTDFSPAMAKALLVNSAVDMGAPDVPNIHEGWGRIHLASLLQAAAPLLAFDQETILSHSGDAWQLDVRAANPSQPVKITLAWSDAAAAPGANPALVNDLDLTVSTNGLTYRGNRFAAGWSIPGGTADTLNNLENVFLPTSGSYVTISVQGSNIAGDGVPYNGDLTDQDFALVCANCALLLTATPARLDVCAPAAAAYTISLGAIPNYNDPVWLSVSGAPPGATSQFDQNPLPPATSTTLRIQNTAQAAAGLYTLAITGFIPGGSRAVTAALGLGQSAPDAPLLIAPADGETNTPRQPTFQWNSAGAETWYELEVSADPDFATIIFSAGEIAGNSYAFHRPLLPNTRYYWRVRPHNGCGAGTTTPAFTFLTAPLPGLCSEGTIPVNVYQTGFEEGEAGWTHGSSGDTWTRSAERVYEGGYSFHAEAINALSNQYLISPAVALPADASPLSLRFWNYQAIDDGAALLDAGCRDGGILEISTNGVFWTQLDAELQTDPYDGLVSDDWGNPLANRRAWCGDPQEWLDSIVSLDAYAGETVQFRFRLGTDVAFGREGWFVDQVRVQACQPAPYAAALSGDSVVNTVYNTVITHTFTLQNEGPDDLYQAQTTGSAWATELLTPSPLPLAYGESGQIVVQVSAPPAAANGPLESDQFQLQVVSLHDPALVLTATGTTNVMQSPDFVWSGDTSQVGAYGHELTYTLTLTNVGEVTDTLKVVIQPDQWLVTTFPDAITLVPGSSEPITVVVAVGAGDEDTADIRFYSTLAHSFVADVTLISSTRLTYFSIFPDD
ncbi:MAG: hypothetical protein Fur0021_16040 [Candidatus Promineifilaceae bacterium]